MYEAWLENADSEKNTHAFVLIFFLKDGSLAMLVVDILPNSPILLGCPAGRLSIPPAWTGVPQ